MDMSFEALMGFGMVAIAIAIGALVLTIAMLGLTFKWAVIVAGNSNPSFLSACGWFLGITLMTNFIQYAGARMGGPMGALLASLLALFVSLYMISSVANCGLFRAFLVSLTHAGFMFLVMMVLLLPLVFVAKMYAPIGPDGKPDFTFGHELDNQFAEIDEMTSEMDRQMADLDKMKAEFDSEFGESGLDNINPVGLQVTDEPTPAPTIAPNPTPKTTPTPTKTPPAAGEGELEPGSPTGEDLLNRGFKPTVPSVRESTPETQAKPKAKAPSLPLPKGVKVNPFFQ